MTSRLEHYGFFLLAGGGAFVINASLLYLMVNWAGFDPFLSQIPSVFAGVVYSWLINRRFTFKVEAAPSLKEFLNYCTTQAASMVVNYGTYSALLILVEDFKAYPSLALVPATAVSMIVSYSGMRWLAFKGKKHD